MGPAARAQDRLKSPSWTGWFRQSGRGQHLLGKSRARRCREPRLRLSTLKPCEETKLKAAGYREIRKLALMN